MAQTILKETIEGIEYEIRKLKRAKRLTLKVSPEGRVWLSMPLGGSAREARSFLQKNLPYVRAALRRFGESREKRQEQEITLPARGVWLKAEILEADSHRIETDIEKGVIRLYAPPAAGALALRAGALAHWRNEMAALACEQLPRRVIELAAAAGEYVKRVAVRDQKTLWGSCTAWRRSISLNWRCALFPDEVRDYIIMHEIAHLKHHNHSPAYWKWLEKLYPRYEEAEAWMAKNGRDVMIVTSDDY